MRDNTRYPKVTVVGAGNVGANTALLLLLKDIANIVLIDVADGVAKGKALDIMHMRSNEQFGASVIGTGDYADTSDSDIVVVTAGLPRKPGMTREDLVQKNATIVRSVLDGALSASPNAIFIFVTNPLDVMTNLAYTIASNTIGLPAQRLMGMGGVLDTARFKYAICEATQTEPSQVDAMVIGAHGEAMVPLPSIATVNGKPLAKLLDAKRIAQITQDTVQGGAKVVELLQTGSAFYAPASSISAMVCEILAPTNRTLSVCARLNGEYGIQDLHMCVPCKLGKEGVASIVNLPLSNQELDSLKESAESVRKQVELVL
ncbi:MAG: malate dehydrogenase [Coriobacteriales bacterium]|nr:malate dehydrogenase [Coriobacteriales bacterium]